MTPPSRVTVQCGLPQLDRPYDWVVGATLLELHRTGEGRIVSIAGGPRGLTLKAIDDANMRLPQAFGHMPPRIMQCAATPHLSSEMPRCVRPVACSKHVHDKRHVD